MMGASPSWSHLFWGQGDIHTIPEVELIPWPWDGGVLLAGGHFYLDAKGSCFIARAGDISPPGVE
jgi:hypothetical protein